MGEFKVCYEEDFDAWNAENNPEKLPVLHREQLTEKTEPKDYLGGWVLREPPTQSDNWVRVPLQCIDTPEDAARAARRHRAGLDPEFW